MRTRQDVENYLLTSPYACEEVADGTWLIHDRSQPEDTIVLRIEGELVVYRLKVLDASHIKDPAGLYKRLLELNGSDMAHGAYALSEGNVVLTSVARLGTLDPEELQSMVDDFILAVQNHHRELKAFCS